MTNLVKELKRVMKEKHLSAESTSRHIGCSAKTIHRWLYNKSTPNLTYQRLIRDGIDKIKKAYPEMKKHRPRFQLLVALCTDNLRTISEKEKDFWEEVISKMNDNETKATCWAGTNKETMKKQILKAARRLNIPIPE